MHVLIYDELFDKRYVFNNTIGFERLKQSVKNTTPEWAYPITSIKPELIRETAKEMAKYLPATIFICEGIMFGMVMIHSK